MLDHDLGAGYHKDKFHTSLQVLVHSAQGLNASNLLEQLGQLSNDLNTLDPSHIATQEQLRGLQDSNEGRLGPRPWNLERHLLFSICSKALALGDGMTPQSLMANQVRSILGEWNLCLRTFVDVLGVIVAANAAGSVA
jgi:hypothetical protein